jgi:hypothetical protein
MEPFTLEIIMCFTLNSALLCAGSIFQWVTAADVAGDVAMGEAPFIRVRGEQKVPAAPAASWELARKSC